MYANRIGIRILKSKFENSNFVLHPYLLHDGIVTNLVEFL